MAPISPPLRAGPRVFRAYSGSENAAGKRIFESFHAIRAIHSGNWRVDLRHLRMAVRRLLSALSRFTGRRKVSRLPGWSLDGSALGVSSMPLGWRSAGVDRLLQAALVATARRVMDRMVCIPVLGSAQTSARYLAPRANNRVQVRSPCPSAGCAILGNARSLHRLRWESATLNQPLSTWESTPPTLPRQSPPVRERGKIAQDEILGMGAPHSPRHGCARYRLCPA